MTTTVVFRACHPTQSWGAAGNASDDRPTAPHPLQSAVTGLIAAALGIKPDDEDAIAQISAAAMAFRFDRKGRITHDYQTIQNTISADGDPRGTIISRRGELQDACITMFCAWEDHHLARRVSHALRFPRWPLYLGRRCHLVGALPDAVIVEEPISDDLLGSWAPCEIHSPQGEQWRIVEDTTAPLNAEGVTVTGSRASSFARRDHTAAAVRTRSIPRLAPRELDQVQRVVLVDGSGVVVTDADTAT